METGNTFWRRIRYLFLLQSEQSRRRVRKKSIGKTLFRAFLELLLFAAVTAVITVLFYFLQSTFSFKLGIDMLSTLLLLSQIVSVLTLSGTVSSVLFGGREGKLLLAYPCKHREIFFSQILVLYVEECKKNRFLSLPFLIAFGISAQGGANFFLVLLPFWLLLCFIPILLAAILSIPLVLIKKFFAEHPAVAAVSATVGFLLLFGATVFVCSRIPTPIRILAEYDKFIRGINTFLVSSAEFSLYYRSLASVFFGVNVLPNIALFLGTVILLLLALYFLVMPYYFRTVSAVTETGRTEKVRSRKERKTRRAPSLFRLFCQKEWRMTLRSSESLTNAVTVILCFPVLLFVLNFILRAINTNVLGDYLIVGFNLMIALSLLGTANAAGAMAISREGSEFAVTKVSPSDNTVLCWAKISVAATVNLVAILSSTVMLLAATSLSLTDVLLIAATLFFVSTGELFHSFELDIRHPKINDYAVKGDAVSNNENVGNAMLSGFITAILFGVLSVISLYDTYAFGWFRVILVAACFFGARLYLLCSNLYVYFDDIEI